MNIGIDLDEVTIEFLEALLKFIYKKTGQLRTKNEFNDYSLEKALNITPQEALSLVTEFHEIHKHYEIQPVEGAVKAIKELQKKHKVSIITARPQKYKLKTQDYLLQYFKFPLLDVYISGDKYGNAKNKFEICKEKNIPLILEDMPKTALECANSGIKVILFDKPWNQNLAHENIFRVENWVEAIGKIKEFESQFSSASSISIAS